MGSRDVSADVSERGVEEAPYCRAGPPLQPQATRKRSHLNVICSKLPQLGRKLLATKAELGSEVKYGQRVSRKALELVALIDVMHASSFHNRIARRHEQILRDARLCAPLRQAIYRLSSRSPTRRKRARRTLN